MRGTEGSRQNLRGGDYSAALKVDITVDPSVEEVERSLSRFNSQLQAKGLHKGLVAAASPIKRRMKAAAPSQPGGGALKKSIGYRTLSLRSKSSRGIPREARALMVGVVRKVADPKYKRSPGKKISQMFKAMWIERGTKPHMIPENPDEGVAMAFGGKVLRSVEHPGFHAKPFIFPAYQAELPNVDKNYVKGISKFIDKI